MRRWRERYENRKRQPSVKRMPPEAIETGFGPSELAPAAARHLPAYLVGPLSVGSGRLVTVRNGI
jgi:hypothetical protein